MRIAKACVACGGDRLDRVPAVLMPFLAHRIFGWESVEIGPDWGLRDLAPGRTHAACATLACRDCGLLLLDMRFDEDEMAALYADYRGPSYCAARARFEPGYAARNAALDRTSPGTAAIEALLAPHLPPAPRVLDWGGDTGRSTPFRRQCAVHHVHDISGKALVPGAVRVGAEALDGSYDLVVLAHVLEHLPDPLACLTALAPAVAGILSIEVPHEAVMRGLPAGERARAKRHWHEHVNFFTPEAIEAIVARAGLRLVRCLAHVVEAGEGPSHVLSAVCRR